MADVTIDGTISTATARAFRAVAFHPTNNLIGYFFYIDSDGTFGYSKTTDGGATWGAQVEIAAATTHLAFDIWAEWWTPGRTSSTLIHCTYFDTTNDDVFWRTLNVSSDTLGTQRTVFNGATAVAGRGVFCSVTVARDGKIYCAYDIDAGAEKGFHQSTDGGTTWSASLLATFIEATLDEALLFPALNTGDNADCLAIYLDASATALTMKMWDNDLGTANESSTIQTHLLNATAATDLTGQHGYAASIRHSDGKIILAAVTEYDTVTADHHVYEVNCTGALSYTITSLTSIVVNIDDHYYPSVFIDQDTDDIYVAYNGVRNGTDTLGTSTNIRYVKSTDGGVNWSAGNTTYSENAATTNLQLWTPLMGPRFYVGWRRASTTLVGNFVSSVTFGGVVQVEMSGAVSSSGTASGSIVSKIPLTGPASGLATLSDVLSAIFVMSGAASSTGVAAGTITLRTPISGATSGAGSSAGTITLRVPISGAVSGLGAAVGELIKQITLQGAASSAGSATGSLAQRLAMIGAVSGSGALSGVLVIIVPLSGTSAGVGSGSGSLSQRFAIVGAVSGAGSAAGTVVLKLGIEGDVDGIASLSAALSQILALQGQSDGLATLFGDLEIVGGVVQIEMVGTAEGLSTVAGALAHIQALTGQADGVGTPLGTFTLLVPLSGASSGAASLTGALAQILAIQGQSDGAASLAGALSHILPLQGQSNGLASLAAALSQIFSLQGQSSGFAILVGDLEIAGAVETDIVGAAQGIGTTEGELQSILGLAGTAAGLGITEADLNLIATLIGQSFGIATAEGNLTFNVSGVILFSCPSAVEVEPSQTIVELLQSLNAIEVPC